ncbi:MAG: 30S ribosomal protein S3 [Candidatus Woesearchaeota archaeon]|jgi:small subunit ribosomal protein S3|nr:30S ribosomal protein S3 [Candidatus Woesearchaeota archaeon]
MIERQFIQQKIKEFQIQVFLAKRLARTGYSHSEIQRTPLGEKIIIYTTRPGIVVGKRGENIQELTETLKKKFNLENPQIEIGEINNENLDVYFVADKIASSLERFGSKRFKSIGYRVLQDIINAGAMGAEIVISGKVPSQRARSWRFSAGYLKKSGDIAENKIKKAYASANLKSGIVGIKVSIMTPDIELPDKFIFREEPKKIIKEEIKVEEIKTQIKEEKTSEESKEIKKPRTKLKKKIEDGNTKKK